MIFEARKSRYPQTCSVHRIALPRIPKPHWFCCCHVCLSLAKCEMKSKVASLQTQSPSKQPLWWWGCHIHTKRKRIKMAKQEHETKCCRSKHGSARVFGHLLSLIRLIQPTPQENHSWLDASDFMLPKCSCIRLFWSLAFPMKFEM